MLHVGSLIIMKMITINYYYCVFIAEAVIGFRQTLIPATEGIDASVQLEIAILSGDLRRDVVVMVATEDGTAVGEHIIIYNN